MIAHFPELQLVTAFAALHELLHFPQFCGSDCSSTQASVQSASPVGQVGWHVVPSQLAVPPAGAMQGVQELPQLLTEALLWHVPLQACCPVGHAQLPF